MDGVKRERKMENKYKIYIVEDDVDLAKLNARLLSRNGYLVQMAYSLTEARSQLLVDDMDLYILDVNLPDGDGMAFGQEIRAKTEAPMIFLTGNSDTASKVKGFQVGGDYYLTKPYDKEELLAIIQSLLRKAERVQEKNHTVHQLECGALRVNLVESKAYINQQDVSLTPKEFSILRCLMQHKEKELSYEEIYQTVWGVPMCEDSSALRKQMSRLKAKLREDEFDCFSILNTQGRGYILTKY